MAELSFKGYTIKNISYQENEIFDEKMANELQVDSDFSVDIGYHSGRSLVIIKASVGECENPKCPFMIEIQLNGLFYYTVEDGESFDEVEKLLSVNAVAILYPYLRSVISDITLKTNKFPAYIMPVTNFVEAMDKQNKINVFEFNEDDKAFD